eukprot:3397151-Pleurochrysis_carterae.AAC.3
MQHRSDCPRCGRCSIRFGCEQAQELSAASVARKSVRAASGLTASSAESGGKPEVETVALAEAIAAAAEAADDVADCDWDRVWRKVD